MPEAERPAQLHRIVRSNPPTLDDFLSGHAAGEPPPVDLQRHALWQGVSMFNTWAQARNKARAYRLGSFVATVRVDDERISVRRTLMGRGHHTVWADPEVLLRGVVDTKSIDALE